MFEPNIFEVAAAACGFNHPTCTLGETPADPPSEAVIFAQTLAAGDTALFNFALEVSGNASVMPAPLALPLMLSGLALIALFRRRRKSVPS